MNNAPARGTAIGIEAKTDGPEGLDTALHLTQTNLPRELPSGFAVIEIRSARVNPSDVNAVLGAMPQAVWPRTPGGATPEREVIDPTL